MGLRQFISENDDLISTGWNNDKNSLEYTEGEARVATVLTRLDVALDSSINAYNARTLESIKRAVWSLVALAALNLLLKLVL